MFGTYAARIGVTGLLLGFVCPVLAASENPGAPVAVRAADISHYDCAASATSSLHIGQVIQGRYYEWNEIYGGSDGEILLCVSMRAPEFRQLDANQAKTFLLHSAAIGVPNPQAVPPSTSQIETPAADLDVIPEPPKRLRKGGPGVTSDSDIPPVPAEHRPGDPNIPAAVVPAPEPPEKKAWEQNTLEQSADGDPRIEVTNPQAFPYSAIGYLSVSYPNGKSYRCTGTIVSPYVVLTAGHCVHNNSRGGWVTSVNFYPAQYVSAAGFVQRPYGGNASWSKLKATQRWTQISGPNEFNTFDYRHDYAAIQFSNAFTHITTFMPVVYGTTTPLTNNAGYPGNLKDSSATEYGLFQTSGNETTESVSALRSIHVREFALYSSGGDSGGPFWSIDNQNRQALVGSLSYTTDDGTASGGPWYDSWNQSLLSSWVAWTPSSDVISSLPTTGLRVGAVFSTTQATSQSFLRFYNSSSSPGTVSVTLSDSATGTPLTQWTSPSIPAGASPQFAISTIEAGSNQGFTKSAYYSLAIQSGFAGAFQHVLWRTSDGSLTNLSTCDSLPTSAGRTLINVHSSLLASGYPSQVMIFNTGDTAANATIGIYDAATGGRIGAYSASGVPANGQVLTTVANMETAARISTGSRHHYVLKIDNAFTGFLQHLVNNQQSGVTIDMTGVCPLVKSFD